MTLFLKDKQILLGITGSIAAYKSAEIVRRLREVGCRVRVMMTENAKRFITPLTMQAVSGFPIHDDLFDPQAEAAMGHIELARWADLILIAPASADFIAKLTHGFADQLILSVCLATSAPIVIAPAMNRGMWQQAITQTNIEQLTKRGIEVLGPSEGSQACGDQGPGRMLEPLEILAGLNNFCNQPILSGVNVLVTAGPTHEAIDPIRYLTNKSSGKMGFEIAKAAYEAGASVTLISGPVSLSPPDPIRYISVTSAQNMYDAVMNEAQSHDIFIAVAAVSDYRCKQPALQKIHKKDPTMILSLAQNPDIVKAVSGLHKPPFIVGFAAETEDLINRAKIKRREKNMDLIIANLVGEQLGMETDENEVVLIDDTQAIVLPMASKAKIARSLIQHITAAYQNRSEKTYHEPINIPSY